MNKLKIFLTTFAICIMSVGFSFADSSITHRPNDTGKKYTIVLKEGNNYLTVYFDDYVISNRFATVYDATYYTYRQGTWAFAGELPQVSWDASPTYVLCYSSDSIFLKEWKNSNLNHNIEDLISPPQIPPTIQGAIQGIVPTFSKQLLAFLPKALVIFSMVLSIPLIPRVIRLFF